MTSTQNLKLSAVSLIPPRRFRPNLTHGLVTGWVASADRQWTKPLPKFKNEAKRSTLVWRRYFNTKNTTPLAEHGSGLDLFCARTRTLPAMTYLTRPPQRMSRTPAGSLTSLLLASTPTGGRTRTTSLRSISLVRGTLRPSGIPTCAGESGDMWTELAAQEALVWTSKSNQFFFIFFCVCSSFIYFLLILRTRVHTHTQCYGA